MASLLGKEGLGGGCRKEISRDSTPAWRIAEQLSRGASFPSRLAPLRIALSGAGLTVNSAMGSRSENMALAGFLLPFHSKKPVIFRRS